MEFPLHSSCSVLKAASSGLTAVDKAPGVLSHPNRPGDRPASLLDADYDSASEAYAVEGKPVFLLNRLDAPTSGVILLCTDPDVAAAVKAAFVRHAVDKRYAALVKGVPPRKHDTWRDNLVTRRTRSGLRTMVVPGKPDAECSVELMRRAAGPPARALLRLAPRTGRTHQLRVQCAARRLPVIGDATYGDFAFNREFKRRTGLNRLFLHSWKTTLEFDLDGRKHRFSAESPLPGAFTVALG